MAFSPVPDVHAHQAGLRAVVNRAIDVAIIIEACRAFIQEAAFLQQEARTCHMKQLGLPDI